MIRKTISVVALMSIMVSIGVTPAFAEWNPEIFHHISGVDRGDTYLSSQQVRDCGGETDKCGAQLYVRNTSVDFIKTYYKIGGLGVSCDVNFKVELNGNVIRDITFRDHETFGQWEYTSIYMPQGIQSTDSITSITSFDNCYTVG